MTFEGARAPARRERARGETKTLLTRLHCCFGGPFPPLAGQSESALGEIHARYRAHFGEVCRVADELERESGALTLSTEEEKELAGKLAAKVDAIANAKAVIDKWSAKLGDMVAEREAIINKVSQPLPSLPPSTALILILDAACPNPSALLLLQFSSVAFIHPSPSLTAQCSASSSARFQV